MTPELIPGPEVTAGGAEAADLWIATGSGARIELRPAPGQEIQPGWWRLRAELAAEGDLNLNPALGVRLAAPHPRAGEEALVPLPQPRNGQLRALVELPPVATLALRPCSEPGRFRLRELSLERLSGLALAVEAAGTLLARHRFRAALGELVKDLLGGGWRGLAGLQAWRRLWLPSWLRRQLLDDYPRWAAVHGTLSRAQRDALAARWAAAAGPTISLLMDPAGAPAAAVAATVDSLLRQLYPRWQLLVMGPVGPELGEDPRVQRMGVPIEEALAAATGELVGWLAAGDRLAEQALGRAAEELLGHPDALVIYSDEDRLDGTGTVRDPDFKPDWNPDLCLAAGLFGGFTLLRRTAVQAVSGPRAELAGAETLDLTLRVLETLPSLYGPEARARVRHLPAVLCHRSAGVTAEDADAACRAVREHLRRRGVPAQVEPGSPALRRPHRRLRYPLPHPEPEVSVIVPTRDRPDLLARCTRGLLRHTDYPRLRLILIDHDSRHPRARHLLDRLSQDPRVTVLPFSGPFNHSAMCNLGVSQTDSELVALLNNDVEVLHRDWLREMASQALRPEIGLVGARLLFAGGAVQHGGVVLGLGHGIAGHAHRGFPGSHPGYQDRARLPQNPSAVTAACLVMRRRLYLDAGGLDAEHLAVAYNDVDLCLRLGSLGYRILWTPYAELRHRESTSREADRSAAKPERLRREEEVMRQRWGHLLRQDPAYNPNLTLDREDFGLS